MTLGAALFLVALCGGYYFVSVFIPTRYRSAREVGHRFYFRVVHYTIWLALASSLLLYCVSRGMSASWLDMAARPFQQATFPEAYIEFLASPLGYGIAPLTLLLAIVASHGLNLLLRLWPNVQNQILMGAILGRDLERLILRAHLIPAPLLLILESGKVYVGLVTHALDPAKPREYVRIIPLLGGYSDQRTQRVVLSREHDVATANQDADGADKQLARSAEERGALVIPVERIVSARILDRSAYPLAVPNGS